MILKPLNDLSLIEEVASSGTAPVYLVGGCVRDWFIGETCLDLDFLFPSYPEKTASEICRKHGGEYRKFEKFLTIRVLIKGRRIDLACFRKEKYPFPASLPEVKKAGGVAEDLKRRDFTANAVALGLKGRRRFEVLDPYKGLEDVKKGELRILHKNSFRDDPTRLFRAARFCGRFAWKLEKSTAASLKEAVKKKYLQLLSRERIRNEILKILAEKEAFPALKLLENWGALKDVLPGAKISRKIDGLKDTEMRLAFLCGSASVPMESLRSLNLEKKTYKMIAAALKPYVEKRAPAGEAGSGQRAVLELLCPGKKNVVFSGLLLGPAELKKLGAENIFWNALLERTAVLQWRGSLNSREEALKRARKELSVLRAGRRSFGEKS